MDIKHPSNPVNTGLGGLSALSDFHGVFSILESLSKAKCSLIQQNYNLFDYYDEVLKDIERVTDIDFGKRIRTLGEIKKVLAKTQK